MTLQELVGQEFTTSVLGEELRMLPTKLEASAGSWRLECQVIGKLDRKITGIKVQLPSIDRGWIVDQNVTTELIEITKGPDWQVPARWEADTFRKYAPGMTHGTITIVGPA